MCEITGHLRVFYVVSYVVFYVVFYTAPPKSLFRTLAHPLHISLSTLCIHELKERRSGSSAVRRARNALRRAS